MLTYSTRISFLEMTKARQNIKFFASLLLFYVVFNFDLIADFKNIIARVK